MAFSSFLTAELVDFLFLNQENQVWEEYNSNPLQGREHTLNYF